MPGKQITPKQEKIYMDNRRKHSQEVSAAKAGFSERSGHDIETGKRKLKKHVWRTREDFFAGVWDSKVVPMLKTNENIAPLTILENLQDVYGEGHYPDNKLRTLQRRVRQWKALEGKGKDAMIQQRHEPGRQGFSDFTKLKNITITIQNKPFAHLLYHFRLAFSKWSDMTVTCGGESYTALAEGLTAALYKLGGVVEDHRTDSLSAAFKNCSKNEKEDMTSRYKQLCEDFGMKASRNNLGVSHENGCVESPHGHLKRRIEQALLLRGSNDFESVEAYQLFINKVVTKHNRRNAKDVEIEKQHLKPLPEFKGIDFTEMVVRVSTHSTLNVKGSTYVVPSRLMGHNLRVHLYDKRLECYLGNIKVITLDRVYKKVGEARGYNVDYRHIASSLKKKPQSFRYSVLRDHILPNNLYRSLWKAIDEQMESREACKMIVGILSIAAEYDCEQALGDYLSENIHNIGKMKLTQLQDRYGSGNQEAPKVEVDQHDLSGYDHLLSSRQISANGSNCTYAEAS